MLQEYQRGWGLGGGGWQPKFRRPGAGVVLPNSDQLDRQKKGGGAKINIFHGCHKYMAPKCKIFHELQLPLCCFNLLKIW